MVPATERIGAARPSWPCRAVTLLASLSLGLLGSGCTSLQWLDAHGAPRSFGLATVSASPTDARITRIVAPGLALRLIPGLAGYSLGWRETVLFQDDADGNQTVIAFADRIYGIAIDSTQLVIGTGRRFAVVEPSSENLIQEIRYVESDPSRSRIIKRETSWPDLVP